MKKLLLTVTILFAGFSAFGQVQKYDWKNMKPEQRKNVIKQMSPKDRMNLLHQFRENMMVSTLDVNQSNEEEFRKLYAEYQAKQNQIKSRFKAKDNYETMTDEEAKRELEKSFEVGQQLLDNRKIYAQKFLQFLKPQQVLEMYQTEGKMRSKIIDKKQDGSSPTLPQRRRP